MNGLADSGVLSRELCCALDDVVDELVCPWVKGVSGPRIPLPEAIHVLGDNVAEREYISQQIVAKLQNVGATKVVQFNETGYDHKKYPLACGLELSTFLERAHKRLASQKQV